MILRKWSWFFCILNLLVFWGMFIILLKSFGLMDWWMRWEGFLIKISYLMMGKLRVWFLFCCWCIILGWMWMRVEILYVLFVKSFNLWFLRRMIGFVLWKIMLIWYMMFFRIYLFLMYFRFCRFWIWVKGLRLCWMILCGLVDVWERWMSIEVSFKK